MCEHKTTSTKTENGIQTIKCDDCGVVLHTFKVYEKLGITRNTMPQLFEHICKRLSEESKAEICPQCGAHKANYKEMMGRECYEEHGKK